MFENRSTSRSKLRHIEKACDGLTLWSLVIMQVIPLIFFAFSLSLLCLCFTFRERDNGDGARERARFLEK